MILCAGEILVDFVNEKGAYARHAGGAPFNVARALASMGAEAGFYGCVGDDGNGAFLRAEAEKTRLFPLVIKRSRSRNTALAFVDADAKGERSFFFHARYTADCELDVRDCADALSRADILHLGSLPLRTAAGRNFARRAAALIGGRGKLSFDINYRDGLFANKRSAYAALGEIAEAADIVKFGEEEFFEFCHFYKREPISDIRTTAEKFSTKKRGRTVFVTMGERGAIAAYDGGSAFLPALPVKVADTTGAGDAFLAGALAALDKGKPTDVALADAVALGAEACKKHGAL